MRNVDLVNDPDNNKVVMTGSGGTIDSNLANTYTLMPSWEKYNSAYILYSYENNFNYGVICKEDFSSQDRAEVEKKFNDRT
jgi:hypothetical protein